MYARAIVVVSILSLCALPAVGQLQSKHQIRCLKELWKAGAQVAQAQGKENTSCVKSSAKGKLDAMTAQSCMSADMKKRVAKKLDRALALSTLRCSVEDPTYGWTVPENVTAVGSTSQIDLVEDVFGSDIEAAMVSCAEDKAGCGCQIKTAKALADLSAVHFKEFTGCAKRAVKVSASPFLGGVLDPEQFEQCLIDDALPWSVAADERGKVAKAASKLATVISSKCSGTNYFPGTCGAESGSALAACLEDRVDCHSCLAIEAMYDLSIDCDLYDNDLADLSCP